jgi:hypothetical protein
MVDLPINRHGERFGRCSRNQPQSAYLHGKRSAEGGELDADCTSSAPRTPRYPNAYLSISFTASRLPWWNDTDSVPSQFALPAWQIEVRPSALKGDQRVWNRRKTTGLACWHAVSVDAGSSAWRRNFRQGGARATNSPAVSRRQSRHGNEHVVQSKKGYRYEDTGTHSRRSAGLAGMLLSLKHDGCRGSAGIEPVVG